LLPQNAEVSSRRLLPRMDYNTTEKIMEQNTIPYYAHEGIVARMERTIRRLWILCIILIILLAGTNAAWIYYENSFEDVVVTQENCWAVLTLI